MFISGNKPFGVTNKNTALDDFFFGEGPAFWIFPGFAGYGYEP